MRSPILRSPLVAAIVAGLGLASSSLPVQADIGLNPAAAALLDAQGAVFKRPSAVGVTNVATGEQGCHNEKTQTSEPGPCPKDY